MKLEESAKGTELQCVTEDSKQSAAVVSQQDDVSSATPDLDHHEDWRIILYYCYMDLDVGNAAVDQHVEFQRDICQQHELLGRIRVSPEGINGVLSGRRVACQAYEEQLRAELTRLISFDTELDVKYCKLRTDLPVSTQVFDSLMVKATNSVVSLFEPGMLHHDNDNDNKSSTKKKYSKQSNRRKRRQQQRKDLMDQDKLQLDNHLRQLANQVPNFPGALHLSPQEWDRKLQQARGGDAILLDCRNVYESNVGYFQVTSTTTTTNTLLTNTRKYSDLPKILLQSKDQWAHKKQIFMYCTGGVRCEMASKFVQAVVATNNNNQQQQQQSPNDDVQVYQLHGGIQKYLEHHYYNNQPEQQNSSNDDENNNNNNNNKSEGFYRGLNFVFDPRRTDPMVIPQKYNNTGDADATSTTCVGKCCRCGIPHDDYDNGHAPVENKEARCCKCRILLLVCNACRDNVQCWGEPEKEGVSKLFCGIDDHCGDYQATGQNPVSIVGGAS
ncbi:Rhodanese-like domain-containing protein 6 [Seminavis robusta]|uniref:Rhodanese-like domain-containing protein 6 n=1 Tax=Seminavis robusta TaxID=568900 RepID=A0A9N8EUF5_9STRA|nr:Rhodanese-like domain-containing protein 6 [Seminavis robusta]|eukprot:Sro1983_g309270.1 Rhodanese-like domain-containing protein 6 (498) ;mRNA; f:15720-17213